MAFSFRRKFAPLAAVVAGLTVGAGSLLRAEEAAPENVVQSVNALPRISALPDPLLTPGQAKVASVADWPLRRKEIRAVVERYFSGHLPPAPGKVIARLLAAKAVPGAAFRRLQLVFGPQASLSLEVGVFVPTSSDGPDPTLIFLSPFGTPGSPDPTPLPARYQSVTPEEFALTRASALARGYAIVTYYFQQGALDQVNNRDSGFFPAYPDYDWGTLAVWAWTLSRAVDFVETQSWADPARIGIVGHSRLGKTTLLAGALDERIALVVAAGSGFGGTGAMRINGKARGGKEGLEEATARFPYWFGPRLPAFAGQVERLPFDANWIMSLVAPRALLDCEAYDDPYCNGRATMAAYRATAEVYHFLHAEDRLGLHFRAGGHALTDDDWTALLDFADHQFKAQPVQEDFHALPDESRLR